MRVYVVRKWPLMGRSRFVCWNITRVSLWSLCNVRIVQITQELAYRQDHRAWYKHFTETGCVGKQKAPILTRVWQGLKYRIDMCRVTRGAHIVHL